MSLAWNSWADFVSMGGYGLYVWGAFGVTAAVMALESWQLARHSRALAGGGRLARPEHGSATGWDDEGKN